MALFKVSLLDSTLTNVGTDLQLLSTGTPGLFQLQENNLGLGEYTIIISPSSSINSNYVWAEPSWSKTVSGTIHPLFYALIVAGGLFIAGVGFMGWRTWQSRKHPLSGYIHVFSQIEAADEQGSPRARTLYKRQLPSRNRVVLTQSKGLLGWIERVLPTSSAKKGKRNTTRPPFRYMIVTCKNEEDAKVGRARVQIKMRDGKDKELTLSPNASQPSSLGMGFFIEKGPKKRRPGADDTMNSL
jgi:hypothetical protein